VDLALLDGLVCKPGASDETLRRIEERLGVRFPDEYREFIQYSNGARGSINDVDIWLWSIEEIPTIMEAWRIREKLPAAAEMSSWFARQDFAIFCA
jgi:cell wall assembly regulator SMI1